MSKKILSVLLVFVTVAITNSCTKLKEQVLDESSVAGLTDRQQAEGITAPVYAKLEDVFTHTNYFDMQEISTDEAILPFRGGKDWDDNGIYVQMHKHELISSDANVLLIWTNILTGLSRAVTAINALPSNKDDNAKVFLAEARGMRAYYSILTLDLFGLIFVKEVPTETSKILRGEEAIAYIKSELLAVEPLLDNNSGTGRLTKAAVQGLLVRLYLNSAVYRNIYASNFTFKNEEMDKVIEYCDKIINSGQYALVTDYFSIFNDNNHTNKEIIFAVDQRFDLNGHNRLAYFSLSGDQFPLPLSPTANGTDAGAITPDFYRTWVNAYSPVDPAAADPRFYKKNLNIPSDSCLPVALYNIDRGILRGQQYGMLKGAPKCANGNLKITKLFNCTRFNGAGCSLPVDFTEKIDFTIAGSAYSTGYRVSKYEFSKSSTDGRKFGEHDIVILRLADIYLMRAEAKLRKGDAAGALADVNIVRAVRTAYSAPPPPLTSMSFDILFRERGFEFYWEMLRRTDMIRFGKYEGSWTEKTSTDVKKRLMPIPLTAIDAASNIPGYLIQNDSY